MKRNASIAQLVEHLICNQGVAGSSPAGGTINLKNNWKLRKFKWLIDEPIRPSVHLLDQVSPYLGEIPGLESDGQPLK